MLGQWMVFEIYLNIAILLYVQRAGLEWRGRGWLILTAMGALILELAVLLIAQTLDLMDGLSRSFGILLFAPEIVALMCSVVFVTLVLRDSKTKESG